MAFYETIWTFLQFLQGKKPVQLKSKLTNRKKMDNAVVARWSFECQFPVEEFFLSPWETLELWDCFTTKEMYIDAVWQVKNTIYSDVTHSCTCLHRSEQKWRVEFPLLPLSAGATLLRASADKMYVEVCVFFLGGGHNKPHWSKKHDWQGWGF